MGAEYHSVGELLPDLDPSRLAYDESRRLLAACLLHPAFDVVETRRLTKESECGGVLVVDGIVVECCGGTIPAHSPTGIKSRERLILLHGPELVGPYNVRALRVDFPVTPHQNHVIPGEAASLCLYFEPWSAVERTWTAAKHLQRILWWLHESAFGTLHRSDQPVEQLYFLSRYQIVLPADFNEHVGKQGETLQLACARSRPNGSVLRGTFTSQNTTTVDAEDPRLDALTLTVPPALVTHVERYPATLGELHKQLAARGSGLLSNLVETLKKATPGVGLPIRKPKVQHTLLLLRVPVMGAEGTQPTRIDSIGFIVHHTNLACLGIACGAAFDGKDGKAYVDKLAIEGATGTTVASPETWSDLTLEPVDVRIAFTPKEARKASGISDEGADFQGVIAGVGALGGCMADLWCRTGWGRWSYIDDDILHAHNFVRHIAKEPHLGWAKVDAVAAMVSLTGLTDQKPVAIAAKVTDLGNNEVTSALAGAGLLVDATTTLEVPRDLSDRDDSPRMASTFLTPSGRDCALLLEDISRKIRLHSIEAQYYRAILNTRWGEAHLNGHHGTYWVGGGCRDLSGVLSQDVVQLHGSTLARQVRLLTAKPEAQIRVWTLKDETGMLISEIVPVMASKETKLGEWRVIWDEGLEAKLRSIRAESLPNETGGVILGYVDQKRMAIHVVDVLCAPSDSVASRSEFIRGAVGVREAIERAANLTANIVGYLGEWHSHPLHSSAKPSTTDAELLAHLAGALAMDGMPALMVIVGENDISISLGEEQVA